MARSKKDTIILYKKVFGTDDGIKVIKDMMKNCSFVNGTYSEDQGRMYFNEGRRSVVCEILSWVEMDMDMMKAIYTETEEDEWMENQ